MSMSVTIELAIEKAFGPDKPPIFVNVEYMQTLETVIQYIHDFGFLEIDLHIYDEYTDATLWIEERYGGHHISAEHEMTKTALELALIGMVVYIREAVERDKNLPNYDRCLLNKQQLALIGIGS